MPGGSGRLARGDRPASPTIPANNEPVENRRGCWGRAWRHFAEQRPRGHTVVQDLRVTTITMAIMTVILFVGGGILIALPLALVEEEVVYSDPSVLDTLDRAQRTAVFQGQSVTNVGGQTVGLPISSTETIVVTEDMDEPVYVYYVLKDFFQNHKRYVRSVDYDQVHGKTNSTSNPCKPEDRLDTTGVGAGGLEALPLTGTINPCGLQAWSTFNDTFSNFRLRPAVEVDGGAATDPAVEPLSVDSSRLVWDTDRDFIFDDNNAINLNTIEAQRGGRSPSGPLNEDEHFMAWMRPYGKPDTVKFFGVIRRDLKKGDEVLFDVQHAFNTYAFDGEKRVRLTTQSSLGGRNPVFGIFWLAGGVFAFASTLMFLIMGGKQLRYPRERRAWLQERWEHLQ